VKLKNRLEEYFDRLWPIHRSLAGPGYRKSLGILSEIVPFEQLEFPTGTKVFDWTIPKEWHVNDAYIVDPNGVKRLDVKTNNLHLVGYSVPFQGRLSLEELKEHLHSLPEMPDAVPYMVSYYEERWGFCISHRELKSLCAGEYQVFINTELKNGHVVVGEAVLEGDTDEEILFSSYLCHPSMANNELSGPLVLAFLYERLAALKNRRYTYRFVIGPETIGAIAYLSIRGSHFKRKLRAGYVLTCIGNNENFTYKKSRIEKNSIVDKAAELVLRDFGKHTIVPFFPNGSDERQYCSPGFNLPVGSLMRSIYSNWPEYHTSLDNKQFINFRKIAEAVDVCEKIVIALENNYQWISTCMECEPFLSSYGVFPTQHSVKFVEDWKMAILWILNMADGSNDLLAVAQRSNLPMDLLIATAKKLANVGLLEKQDRIVKVE